jgi:hypothetical protein
MCVCVCVCVCVYFQPFSIIRIKVQDISILSTSISNVTYTLWHVPKLFDRFKCESKVKTMEE